MVGWLGVVRLREREDGLKGAAVVGVGRLPEMWGRGRRMVG